MIQVIAWDPVGRVITIDINGSKPQTQAVAPPELLTQEDWMAWLESVVQPVVDAMIKEAAYDPNKLIQLGDLSTIPGMLTQAETDGLTKLFPITKGA